MGRLEEHPFAEVAGLLYRQKKTGKLKLSAGGRSQTVYFQGGNPIAVESDDPENRLVRILAENGKITPEEAAALENVPETKEDLLAIDFPPDVLSWALKSRLIRLIDSLFSWEEGEFRFFAADIPPELLTLKVPLPFFILRGTSSMPTRCFEEITDGREVVKAGALDDEDGRFIMPAQKNFLSSCKK